MYSSLMLKVSHAGYLILTQISYVVKLETAGLQVYLNSKWPLLKGICDTIYLELLSRNLEIS